MDDKDENKTTVLKVGGSQLVLESDIEYLCRYVIGLRERDHRIVIVHGGGPQISEMQRDLGQTPEKKSGLRATPKESMPTTTMVLCGLVNKRVVSRLVAAGVRALGLSGIDLGLLRSRLLNEQQLGRVGGPPRVDAGTLEYLLDARIVPVLAPVSAGPDGLPVNVNADTVAQSVAEALSAQTLDFISDVHGVRGEDGWVKRISKKEVTPLVARSVVTGGMIPKLQAATVALENGVGRVRVGSLVSLAAGTATVVTS